jgi:hypothetical protein
MTAPRDPSTDLWVDEDAGPVVRHYALSLGAGKPSRCGFDPITLIVANPDAGVAGLTAEQSAILRLCQSPMSVAELATRLALPLRSIRVLLGDLHDRQYIRTRSPIPASRLLTDRVFRAVVDGLGSL